MNNKLKYPYRKSKKENPQKLDQKEFRKEKKKLERKKLMIVYEYFA